jgi:2-amino-4-hydroxy-6-hydroxymethyldihydropteridine diphosphokinase
MKYVIALGSNLGDRQSILIHAIDSIKLIAEVIAVSSFYETNPVGGPEQPNYLNGVVIVNSEKLPEELLKLLQEIENSAGRTREIKWGARTLDLDLISAGEIQMETEFLTLPHPRAHERAFVLQPWIEIEPDGAIVGKGQINDLLAALGSQE